MSPSRWSTLLIAAACCALLAQAAPAASFWPFKSSESKGKHAGVTLHGGAQHAVKPLGNQLRVVKPIAGNRKPPKTILAKRPP
jgi:hypothetical protein